MLARDLTIGPRARRTLGFIALAVAYVTTGKLMLMLAVAPGYATPIFPPAGIAVGAALIAGAASLPWTFLGSLLLNLWEGYSLSGQLDRLAIVAALLIAVASALQAGIAGAVFRRAIGSAPPLDRSRDIATFVLLSPVCCIVSATVAHAGLLLLGTLAPRELGSSWLAWWLGDTLGVLFMMPLVLVVAGEPRMLWRNRGLTVALPMLVFLGLFVTIFVRVSAWETDQSLVEYRLLSQQVADKLEAALYEQSVFLDQLGGSFAIAPVSRKSFHRLAGDLPQRFPSIQAVEWAPNIGIDKLSSFLAQQRNEWPNFAITERDDSGRLRAATGRLDFYPVTYVEPESGNEEAVGYDLGSDVERRAAIETAFFSDATTITAPIRLVQEHGTQSGLLLVRSVAEGASGPGVVVTVLRVGDFLEALLGPMKTQIGIEFAETGGGGTLFDTRTGPPFSGAFERSFAFGAHNFVLRTAPTEAYSSAHLVVWQSWAALARGLVGIVLLGALLLLATGQSYRLELLVKARTVELERSYEHIRQAQKIEAVGQLTGGIAHDFNNLLTVIAGNLALLKTAVRGARELRLIEAAERGAESGMRLTQSLLTFARRQVLHPELVDVNAVITEFEPLLRRAAGALVEMECRFAPGLGLSLIDIAQFQAAMLNLVTNARDAIGSAGGRIVITTENVEVVGRSAEGIAPGRYVLVSAIDNGAGMSETVVEHAFEPFYTTKSVGAGSGLGLSQVHGFALQSGGAVILHSKEGQGTTVCLYLPHANVADTETSKHEGAGAPAVPLSASAHEAILIVEDDAEVRELLVSMVTDLGYRVAAAADGPTALALLENGPAIDLLLTDYAIPGMTGDVLIRRVRDRRQGIRALMVSGFPDAPGTGMVGDIPLLRKPFHRDALARAIRDALA